MDLDSKGKISKTRPCGCRIHHELHCILLPGSSMDKYDLIHVGLLLRGNSTNGVVVPDGFEYVVLINHTGIPQDLDVPPISSQGLDTSV